MTYTHVVNGDIAAGTLRQALAAAQSPDPIVVLRDDLAVGPLRGIDENAAARASFWQRVLGNTSRDVMTEFETSSKELRSLVQGGSDVVVWHGQSASDQLTLRRLAYQLRTMPQRLNEIGLSANELTPDSARNARPASLGAYPPEALRARLKTIAPISLLRIGRLALEWQELKQLNHELRRWRGNTFQSGTFTEIDTLVLGHATHTWQQWVTLWPAVLRNNDWPPVTDLIFRWRCRELAENGKLELRGLETAATASFEVRLAA